MSVAPIVAEQKCRAEKEPGSNTKGMYVASRYDRSVFSSWPRSSIVDPPSVCARDSVLFLLLSLSEHISDRRGWRLTRPPLLIASVDSCLQSLVETSGRTMNSQDGTELGSSSVSNAHEMTGTQLQQSLHDAILLDAFRQSIGSALQLIPVAEKTSYVHALMVAPQVVASETEPLWFVRGSMTDPTGALSAAYRLIAYWRERQRLFGDRVHQQVSNPETLVPQEQAILETGFARVYPNIQQASAALMIDTAKLGLFHTDSDAVLRVLYHVIAAENSMYGPRGVDLTVLYLMRCAPGGNSPSIKNLGQYFGVLPARLERFHLLMCAPQETRAIHAITSVPQLMQELGQDVSARILVHWANDDAEFGSHLEGVGVPRSAIPSSLGGDRETTEDQEKPAASVNVAMSNRASRAKSDDDDLDDLERLRGPAAAHVPAAAEQPGEDHQTFIRKRNALYSRRLYHKRKIEMEVLEDRKAALIRERDSLIQANSALDKLLRDGKAVARRFASAESVGESTPSGSNSAGSTTPTSDGDSPHRGARSPSQGE